MRKLDWKDQGDGIWSARILPNPMGMEIEATDEGEWRIWATTPDNVECIASQTYDTTPPGEPAELIARAKVAVVAKAEEMLHAIGRELLNALALDSIGYATRDL